MNETTLSAIDALIASFEKDAYTEQHVKSLLNYLVALEEKEDQQTINAITKVLSFCTKDFVKVPIIETIKNISSSNSIKASLLAVCWESGLDYTGYLNVFVDALIKGNETVAIEAYTLILEFSGKDPYIKQAIEEITQTDQKAFSPAHRILINDSLQHIINLYNASIE
jgi:hypothetical protein